VSYFDHVKCHHCGAMLDPDKLSAGMQCTSCGGELALADLFGIKDAFSENDSPELSLDDLLAPGPNNPYAEDPLKQGQSPLNSAPPGRSAPRPAAAPPARPPASASRPAAPGSRGMVHVPRQDDGDDDLGGTPSALELMRRMKKNR
jgi:hypothetical protein